MILALFFQVYRANRRQPRLTVTMSADPQDGDIAFNGTTYLEMYARPRVVAQPGRDVARNVQVVLIKVDGPVWLGAAGTLPTRPVTWADVLDEKLDVQAGVWRRFDLLNLWSEKPSDEPHLYPSVRHYFGGFPPSARYRLVEPGDYSAFFVLVADNSDATYWRIDFAFHPKPPKSLLDLRDSLSNFAVHQLPGFS